MRLHILQCLFALAACNPPHSSPQDLPLAKSPLAGTWVYVLGMEPAAFETLMTQSEREGWIAFHQHDYEEAYRRFNGKTKPSKIGKRRAATALAKTYRHLAQMQEKVVTEYFEIRLNNPKAPLSPNEVWMQQRTQNCPQEGAEWATVKRRASAPIRQEDTLAGTQVSWFDPCVYRDAESIWNQRRSLLGPAEPKSSSLLSKTIFSGELETNSSTGAGNIRRDETQHLTTGFDTLVADLDSATSTLIASATPEGNALLQDLGAFNRFKQELWLSRCEEALSRPDTQTALRLSSHASALGQPLGPENSPFVFIFQAEIQLLNGHTRDAMNRLAPYATARPDTHTLLEWMGDLSVLKGLDRQGDSKEN